MAHKRFSRSLGSSLPVIIGLLCGGAALARPQQPPSDTPPAKADSDPPSGDDGEADANNGKLSEEERAELKRQLKQEIVAELEQAREQREAQAQADKAAAARQAVIARQAAAHNKKKAVTEAREPANPWVPPDQQRTLANHAVNNDKSTYKPGTGLHIESDDGDFAVATRLRAQLRHQIEFGPEDPSHVFQIRRARLQFKGHAFNKHNKYKIEFAFSPRDLGINDDGPQRTPLLTWYLEFDYLRDLTVRAGQYKIPYSRQRVVSSGDLQLVDRSIANGEFNHDRDIGLDIRSNDIGGLGGYLRYYAGVYMGEGRDFGDRNATADFKLHYLARVEVLPMGKFKDYREADMERLTTPKISLGAAYAFHHQSQGLRGVLGTTASDEGTTDYHSMNVDYAFKYAGFSSNAEFHYRQGTRTAGGATIDDPNNPGSAIPAPVEAARNGAGWHVQAGYLIPRVPFEVAARYSGIARIGEKDPGTLTDTDGFTSLSSEHSVGLGVSYYFGGHPWKLQADYFRGWQNGAFSDGSNAIRTQLQLAL